MGRDPHAAPGTFRTGNITRTDVDFFPVKPFYVSSTQRPEGDMSTAQILADINAVTDAEIAAAELSDDEEGKAVGEPISSRFIKAVATLYYRESRAWAEHCANVDPESLSSEEERAECLTSLRLGVLGRMLDYELELAYGQFITKAERDEKIILDIMEGWVVHKIQASPDEDEEPTSTTHAESRVLN